MAIEEMSCEKLMFKRVHVFTRYFFSYFRDSPWSPYLMRIFPKPKIALAEFAVAEYCGIQLVLIIPLLQFCEKFP